MTSISGYPKQLLVGFATGWLLAACGAAGPEDLLLFNEAERGPALLVFYGETTGVELAASTRVGEATPVRFASFGGGCIRKDTTEVEVSGLSAEIRPYRFELTHMPPNIGCTSDLRVDVNVVQLRFSEPGRAQVRIVGLARPGDHRFVLERVLMVTP